MNNKRRSEYADYLAAWLRGIHRDTNMEVPNDMIIVTKSYGELAELDSILGMGVYVMDMPSDREFFIAFRSNNVDSYSLQKSFLEFSESFNVGDTL